MFLRTPPVRIPGFCLATLVAAAAFAPARGGAQEGGAGLTAFRAAREQARALMDVGRWGQARDALVGALEAHEGQPYVMRALTGVRDDLRRCAFALAVPTPRPEDVIAGRVEAFRPRNRFVSIVYERDPADRRRAAPEPSFPPGDLEELGGGWFHPMDLDGTYTLSVTVAPGEPVELPDVYFGAGPEGMLGFAIGPTPVPVLFASVDGEGRVLADLGRRVERADGFELVVRVRPGRVDVDFDGERMSWAGPGAGVGRFGLSRLERCARVKVEGEGDLSWIERRLDERIERARVEFERDHDEDAALPGWLSAELERRLAATPAAPGRFSGPGAPGDALERARLLHAAGQHAEGLALARSLDAEADEALREWLEALFLFEQDDFPAARAHVDRALELAPEFYPARELGARLAAALRPRDESVAACEALAEAHPDLPEPVELLTWELLLAGRADEAERRLFDALDRGMWTAELERRARALERLRHGPEWRQRFEHASRHYVVRSDVSRELCAEAAEVLDTSRFLFERLLMRPRGAATEKRQVYLFAGQAGYLRYAAEMTGRIPIHTAGLYSPVLKQLLIWNLPERAAMMRTVRHEALHQYVDALGLDAPPWLHEGLGEYFELATVERGQVAAGQANAMHVDALVSRAGLVPLERFLHLRPEEFYADGGRHYAQAWALVHYLRHGGKRLERVWDALLAELAAGRPARAAVDATLGAEDLAALERDLLEHVRGLARAGQ